LCRRWIRGSPTLTREVCRCIGGMCCLIDLSFRMSCRIDSLFVFALRCCSSFRMFYVYFGLDLRLLFVRFVVFLCDCSHAHKNLLPILDLNLIRLLSYYDCQDA
jgi:hypothetical protein